MVVTVVKVAVAKSAGSRGRALYCLFTELERRQAKGQIDKETILLTIEDPKTNVGSGGATINALLTVVEHISARQGFTVSHDGLGEP